jgi:hypothetical protein
MPMAHTCERCSATFERDGRRKYRYCSPGCASRRPSRVDVTLLKSCAEQGLRFPIMAARLGLNRDHLRRLIRQHGLYGVWTKRRYRKCSSLEAAA